LVLKRVQTDGAVVAVEGAVVQGVQALAFVLLAADRAALDLIGEVAEHEPRLDQPPVFLQRPRERSLPSAACSRATSRLAVAVSSRSDAAQRTT
jgi:hypothetical protein